MQYTKHTFFKEIFIFVTLIHFLLMMLLLLFDKGDFEQEKFVINQNKSVSTVVFMPLHKRMPDKSGKSVSGTSDKAHTMSYDAYQKALERRNKSKKASSKSTKKSGKKSAAKKTSSFAKATAGKATKPQAKATPVAPAEKVKALTTLRQEKPKPKAIVAKKVVLPKKSTKVVKPVNKAKKALTQKEKIVLAKTLAQKKIAKPDEALAKITAEKKPVEKIEKKEEKIPEKEVTKIDEIETEKIAEQLAVHEEIASAVEPEETIAEIKSDDADDISDDNDNDDEDDLDIDIDLDNVTFVGRYDMETREIKESIQKEIAKYWKSPVGIAKTTKCEFLVSVGPNGKVLKVDFKKKSGNLAFDMSGRAAIYQSHFIKELCGKEFIIELGAS